MSHKPHGVVWPPAGRVLLFLEVFLVCVTPGSATDPDLESFLQEAWRENPQVSQSDLAVDQARFVKEYADRLWWPSLLIGTSEGDPEHQVSWEASDAGRSVSGTAGLSVVQKLPGGGRVRVMGTAQNHWAWMRDVDSPITGDWTPGVGMDLLIPLASDSTPELASCTLQLEILNQALAKHKAFFALVQAAQDLDLAQQTLVWKQAEETATWSEVEERSQFVIQGRGTSRDLWAAQRRALVARWERIQAEASVQTSLRAWRRVSTQEWPAFGIESLEALVGGPRLEGPTQSLEERISDVQKTLDHLRLQTEEASLAPRFTLGWSTSQPPHSDRVWAGFFGVSFQTTPWTLGPVIESGRLATDRRWDIVIEGIREEHRDLWVQWEEQIQGVRQAKERLDPTLEQLIEVRDALRTLSQRQEATRVEALTAEAQVLALSVDQRRLAWQEVVLSYRLGLPPWVERSRSLGFR